MPTRESNRRDATPFPKAVVDAGTGPRPLPPAMWRRAVNIALGCCLALFLTAYAIAWIKRGSPISGWVAVAFWAGVVSMPLLFLLAFVKMVDWILTQLGGFQQVVRRNRGLCPACGYDLRATPGRCPECGKQPESGTRQQRTPEISS